MNVKIKAKAAKRLRKGEPLLQETDLYDPLVENKWLDFVDEKGIFVGKGYLGKQNNGVGWCLTTQQRSLDQAFFAQRLAQAKMKRKSFYQQTATTAFRLVNGPGDELGGMTVDKYGDFAVISWYNQSLYHLQKEILAAFQTVFPEIKGIYEKLRFSTQKPVSHLVSGAAAPQPLYIRENNVSYAVYLDEGLMTGIFLDQRQVRKYLAEGFARHKEVLNMFSYTGAFSVAAAVGGAQSTTSVDLANRSRQKTIEQFELNQLDLKRQKIQVMDTFDYFKYARKKNLTFDLIILDPPSFARNKKKVFRVVKDYGKLIEASLPLLNPEGVILASTNAANLPARKFQAMIEAVFSERKVNYQRLKSYHLPQDFTQNSGVPDGNYLKVYLYQVK